MVFYLALLFPVGMLLALLVLERLEQPMRLDLLAYELDGFLAAARPEEIETFVAAGFGPALDRYWERSPLRVHTKLAREAGASDAA